MTATATLPVNTTFASTAHAYRAAAEHYGAPCPLEAGVIGRLADHECGHDQLPTDQIGKYDAQCFCWPRSRHQNRDLLNQMFSIPRRRYALRLEDVAALLRGFPRHWTGTARQQIARAAERTDVDSFWRGRERFLWLVDEAEAIVIAERARRVSAPAASTPREPIAVSAPSAPVIAMRRSVVDGSPERTEIVAHLAEMIGELDRDPTRSEYEARASRHGWPSAPRTRGFPRILAEARERLGESAPLREAA